MSEEDVINSPVLVLNQNYEPLNVCRVRRAVILTFRGKAEILENGSGVICSVDHSFLLPSVIRIVYMVKPPHPQKKLTRFGVFNRDNYTCQYCGKQGKQLTLDHIIPRHRGGEHVWENVVSCCVPCNRRKAGHTPEEINMRLIRQPHSPRHNGFPIPHQYLQTHQEWLKFIPQQN